MYSLSFKWENYRDYVLARNFWDTRRLVHQNDDLGNSQNHIPSQRLFICWRNQPTSVLLVGQCCVLNVPSMPFCQAQSWPQSCFNISTYQTKTKHMQNWRVSQCQRDTHTHTQFEQVGKITVKFTHHISSLIFWWWQNNIWTKPPKRPCYSPSWKWG